MTKAQAIESGERAPLLFLAVKWWAYIFAATFVLYGGVKAALAVLDHTYVDMWMLIILFAIGIAQFSVAMGYRDGRRFGWYGLVVINGLIIVLSLFSLRQPFALVAPIISVLALAALFSQTIKSRFSLDR